MLQLIKNPNNFYNNTSGKTKYVFADTSFEVFEDDETPRTEKLCKRYRLRDPDVKVYAIVLRMATQSNLQGIQMRCKAKSKVIRGKSVEHGRHIDSFIVLYVYSNESGGYLGCDADANFSLRLFITVCILLESLFLFGSVTESFSRR